MSVSRVSNTYTPPHHLKENGIKLGGVESARVHQNPVGKKLPQQLKVYNPDLHPENYPSRSFWFVGLPVIEGFAVFELACGEPLVAFWAFALPSDSVLYLFVPRSFVDNFLDEEFLLSIDEYWPWRIECARGEEIVIIFFERGDLRRMEDRESVGRVWDVEGYC